MGINKSHASSLLMLISFILFSPPPTEQGWCFSNDTIFLDDSMHPINASSVQNGDLIQTLSLDNGKWIMTTTEVKLAVEVEGPFKFVQIHLLQLQMANSSTILTVTEDHGLIILDEFADDIEKEKATPSQSSASLVKTIPAKITQIGNKMIGLISTAVIAQNKFLHETGNENIWVVKEIEFVELPQRYVIQTEARTALASNLLTTTSCLHGEE